MSQQHDYHIQVLSEGMTAPCGSGWKFAAYQGDDEHNCAAIIWVREPVPDAWQDHRTEVCDFIQATVTLCPSGYEPTGPWEQYAASSDTSYEFTHWRRPLRKIEGGEG
jgi:hypothetical protein